MARGVAFAAAAAALVATAAAQASGHGKGYNWQAQNGAFTVSDFKVTSSDGSFAPGTSTTISFEGVTKKKILAGTVQWKLYEDYVQHFEASGNVPYFSCDNKGCDPTSPVALTLNNPNMEDTRYKMSFSYVMPKGQKTDSFHLVIWGQDQDHFPYDYSISCNYNFTNVVEEARALKAADSTFTSHWTDGTFKIDSATLSSASGTWSAGTRATVTMKGSVANLEILAGTFKYKIYEYGEQYFVDQGFAEYFHCDNKGCDPNQPIALALTDPTDKYSNFTATLVFTMPKAQKTGIFTLSFFGTDQNHVPYDCNVEVGYNFTMGVPQPRALQAPAGGAPFSASFVDGAFKISKVTMTGTGNTWSAGEPAAVEIMGTLDDKKILAGTLRYKLYEYEVQYFIASGNEDYFQCNNKGCDPTQPIGLTLADPTSPTSAFTAKLPITLPKARKSGIFTLTIWGVDQDHTPYDFSASVGYNFTAAL